jgi:hypothetical protein
MKSTQLVVVVSALALFVTFAFAQSSTESSPTMQMDNDGNMSMKSSMMQDNMLSMGQLMQEMANTFKKQNMSAEQLKEYATHMEELSKIMMKSAQDNELKNVEIQKKEIEERTKKWNYFKSKEFDSH